MLTILQVFTLCKVFIYKLIKAIKAPGSSKLSRRAMKRRIAPGGRVSRRSWRLWLVDPGSGAHSAIPYRAADASEIQIRLAESEAELSGDLAELLNGVHIVDPALGAL